MPRTFFLSLNGGSPTEYTCRESAVDKFYLYGIKSAQNTVAIRMNCGSTRLESVVARLNAFLPPLAAEYGLTIEITRSGKTGWSSYFTVMFTGSLAAVYVFMWWSVLIMRLVVNEEPGDTVEELIRNSSGDESNWYGASDDEERETQNHTADAFVNRSKMNSARMFDRLCGPLTYWYNYVNV